MSEDGGWESGRVYSRAMSESLELPDERTSPLLLALPFPLTPFALPFAGEVVSALGLQSSSESSSTTMASCPPAAALPLFAADAPRDVELRVTRAGAEAAGFVASSLTSTRRFFDAGGDDEAARAARDALALSSLSLRWSCALDERRR